jgi:threonine/homoserine/homoserine lactone efflux protein
MATLLRIFLTGMFISFLGSLPLGTLNIAAMQISISDGVLPALKFACGALLAEVVYVRLSLIAMDWIRHQQKLFRILEWVTLGIVLALAVSSFYAALHPTMEKNVILSSTLHRFFLGLFMSALSPMQIPFWFGWSMVLFTKKILLPLNSHYNIYIAGIGLGTLLGNCVFIFGGRLIAHRFNANQHLVNWIVGGIFAITALVQLWKMFTKKGVQHRLEHPEEETKAFENQVEEMNKEERNQAF